MNRYPYRPMGPQPRQQQPQQGMNPIQGLQMYNKMAPMFGGQPLWGGGAASGAASGAGGASSGMGGALSAAGPWAALAAAIVGNEAAANKAGRRPDDKAQWGGDLLTGKVLERDMEYYGDKVGGPLGEVMQHAGRMGNPEGMFENFKKSLKPWEMF